jgi:hypothetical protein
MIQSPAIIEMTELPVAGPSTELPSSDEVPERISLAVRLAVLAVIIVPIVGVITAPLIVWGWGFRSTDLGLLLILYTLTGLGITDGCHRLFRAPFVRDKRPREAGVSDPRVHGCSRHALQVGRHAPTPPPARRHSGRSTFAPQLWWGRPRRVTRNLARPYRLAIRSRTTRP